MRFSEKLEVKPGSPTPLGSTVDGQGVNFAIFSRHATGVTLCLFDPESHKQLGEISLDPDKHRTGDIWHINVAKISEGYCYAFRIEGPKEDKIFFNYDPNQLVLDPYAKCVATSSTWGDGLPYKPLGVVTKKTKWEELKRSRIPIKDLIIYEMHIRGFTRDPSSNVQESGTFLGVIEKIAHLKEMGINAVELMPVQEFNEQEWELHNPLTNERLYQYWGYSTVNYFSLMNRFSTCYQKSAEEFRAMVKAFHDAGIEVILDVVFNHTAELSKLMGPVLSFKGIDNPIYYMTDKNEYLDFTGCGHTVNCNHPVVREFILSCLRYWVSEMHVDGFRFDLATVFSRGEDGHLLDNSPLIDEIAQDPLLQNIRLIAEPWDAAGGYQVGSFYPHEPYWVEWNGRYRDTVRRFMRGDKNCKGEFATRLCGSEDLYGKRAPYCTINFVTCHDGFTLRDLVSYNEKHNLANGENNRDGLNYNDSWNCGVEGPTDDAEISNLRDRQMKNFHMALMVSQGIPMLAMGDEYGHTKFGNNNTWCQDNTLNWFSWDELKKNAEFFRFYTMMILLRKRTSLFRHEKFLKNKDIEWHGVRPFEPDWDDAKNFIAFTLKGTHSDDIYIAFNAHSEIVEVQIPEASSGKPWHILVNTSQHSPLDIVEEKDAQLLPNNSFRVGPYSALLLKAL